MQSDAVARLRQNPEALAKAVLRAYLNGVLPVDPRAIAEVLGARLEARGQLDDGWVDQSGQCASLDAMAAHGTVPNAAMESPNGWEQQPSWQEKAP